MELLVHELNIFKGNGGGVPVHLSCRRPFVDEKNRPIGMMKPRMGGDPGCGAGKNAGQ